MIRFQADKDPKSDLLGTHGRSPENVSPLPSQGGTQSLRSMPVNEPLRTSDERRDD